MPTITCPNCDESVKVPRDSDGKKVKCPSCRKTIPTQTDDDDAPRKKKKSKKKAVSNLGLIIGLVAGGGALLLVIVAVVIVIVVSGRGPAPGGPQQGKHPATGGGDELKKQIVGKWIGIFDPGLKLDIKPGKESYIEFDNQGTYSSSYAQLEGGSYRALDSQTIELTYVATTGVPNGARTTVIPDTMVNGRVKEGHTLVHEKVTIQMSPPSKMSLSRQGGVQLDFERAESYFKKK